MTQLSEIEVLGIKIMCLYHTGILNTNDYEDGIDLKFLVNMELADFFDYQLDTYPAEYIPSSIYSFIERYKASEIIPGCLGLYDSFNHRFWLATNEYTLWTNRLEPIAVKIREAKAKSQTKAGS